MMHNDSKNILDAILSDWHKWAKGYQHVGGVSSSPMFRDAKTSRGWDTIDEIIDETIDSCRMAAVNFNVMELQPDHRTAIQLNARNLATGLSVWSSPRLPQDPEERAVLLMEARNKLLKRLLAAGVV